MYFPKEMSNASVDSHLSSGCCL